MSCTPPEKKLGQEDPEKVVGWVAREGKKRREERLHKAMFTTTHHL